METQYERGITNLSEDSITILVPDQVWIHWSPRIFYIKSDWLNLKDSYSMQIISTLQIRYKNDLMIIIEDSFRESYIFTFYDLVVMCTC
jgi:hypothetical protein